MKAARKDEPLPAGLKRPMKACTARKRSDLLRLFSSTVDVRGKRIRRRRIETTWRILQGKDRRHISMTFHDNNCGIHYLDIEFRAEDLKGLAQMIMNTLPTDKAISVVKEFIEKGGKQ